MNRIFKISTVFLAGALLMASCQEEKYFQKAEKGPEVIVKAYTENAYMGGMVKFAVELKDASYDLSVLNAKLMYDESEVSKVTLRTKTEGVYEGEILAPLYANSVNSGVASLVLEAVNVGLGKTEETVAVALERPNFETMNLVVDGESYAMTKTADYLYEVTAAFPALAKAFVETPEYELTLGEETVKDVISFGWDTSKSLLSTTSTVEIPFKAVKDGVYTISIDLQTLTAAPFGTSTVRLEAGKTTVANMLQTSPVAFEGVPNAADWTWDQDFFNVDEQYNVSFNAVDGLYAFTPDFDAKFIKVEAMKDESATGTFDMTTREGSIWMIGAGMGKPVVGPSWNTTDGAFCLAEVSPKVHRISFTTAKQLAVSGFSLKFFGQKGWGVEFGNTDLTLDDASGLFKVTDAGNIEPAEGKQLEYNSTYTFTLDVTNAPATLTITSKEAPAEAAKIKVNGNSAISAGTGKYLVKVLSLKKGDAFEFEGIDELDSYFFDPDYFTAEREFNAVDGYYSITVFTELKYFMVRRVAADGTSGTYAADRALWLMGWGAANPTFNDDVTAHGQLAFSPGSDNTYCMAEVEPGVYQMTGVAMDPRDASQCVPGARFCYYSLSLKYFGQNTWGAEKGSINGNTNTVVLTDSARKYFGDAVGGENLNMGKNESDYPVYDEASSANFLTPGKTYVLTIDLSAVDSEGVEKIDFVEK